MSESASAADQPRRINLPALAALWPWEAFDAVRVALTAIAAIWLSMWLEFSLPHWAGWTVISVTLSTRAASLQKSLWRAGATIIGVAIAIALVANFAQATLAFDIALALWLGLLTAASAIERGQRSYGFALMGFTVPIIALADVQHPQSVFVTGVDRCSTILLGIGCAYVSNTLVAPGVPAVAHALADKLDAASDACAIWIASRRNRTGHHPSSALMPIARVMAVETAIIDAFTEQPSLRTGGGQIRDAAPRLRRLLAAEMLDRLLPDRTGSPASALLGDGVALAPRQIDRVRAAARLLRESRRIGWHHVPFQLHTLMWSDLDWDGRRAVKTGLRAAAAVSIVNAFWYVTGWIHGSSAATWAGLLAGLLAAHPNPAQEARAFVVGAALAGLVGLVARYTLLTLSGDFTLLAAVLLPICMMAVLGKADKRVVYGAGFGFLVLGIIDPTNVMTYDLSDSVNTLLAELIGMSVTAAAFRSLPPPVGPDILRQRAQRRLAKGVRGVARGLDRLLPSRDRWLSRAFGRLETAQAITEGSAAGERELARTGQSLLVIGLLVLVVREAEPSFGRRVGQVVWSAIAEEAAAHKEAARVSLEALVLSEHPGAMQAERIKAISDLLAQTDLSAWPGLGATGP